jgi:hypothetical protein
VDKNLAFDLLETNSKDVDGVHYAYRRRVQVLRSRLASGETTESDLLTDLEALDQARRCLIGQRVLPDLADNPNSDINPFNAIHRHHSDDVASLTATIASSSGASHTKQFQSPRSANATPTPNSNPERIKTRQYLSYTAKHWKVTGIVGVIFLVLMLGVRLLEHTNIASAAEIRANEKKWQENLDILKEEDKKQKEIDNPAGSQHATIDPSTTPKADRTTDAAEEDQVSSTSSGPEVRKAMPPDGASQPDEELALEIQGAEKVLAGVYALRISTLTGPGRESLRQNSIQWNAHKNSLPPSEQLQEIKDRIQTLTYM